MEMLHLSSGRDIHYHDHEKFGSPQMVSSGPYIYNTWPPRTYIIIYGPPSKLLVSPWSTYFDTYGPWNQSLTWTPGTRVSTLMKYINPKFHSEWDQGGMTRGLGVGSQLSPGIPSFVKRHLPCQL